MTREEAIEVLENGEWWEELTEWYMVVHPEHNKLHDAVDMAISALRQQEPNDWICTVGKPYYGKTWLAYRQKPEEETV